MMAVRKKKTKPKTKKSRKASSVEKTDDGKQGMFRRIAALSLAWIIAVSAVLVGGWAAFDAMEKQVLDQRAEVCVTRFDSKMINAPRWVPAILARQVAAGSLPQGMDFDDERLCPAVADLAASNPFVKSVNRVTRVRNGQSRIGVVNIEANFRRPYAMVSYEDKHYYVDEEGVRLPAEDVPKFMTPNDRCYISRDHIPPSVQANRIHFIVVYGVETSPPPVGQKWIAGDLEDGLQLIELVRGREYSNQITVVDVRNYRQRISKCEPELRLYAQSGRGRLTEIRFGRFPNSRDWVIPPERKMQYLDQYVDDHDGTLAGIHSYLDLRYDELHISPN